MKTESRLIKLSDEKKTITSVEEVYRILMNEIEKNYRIIEENKISKIDVG